MELKAFRRSRLQAAMQELGTQVLVASLPQNITYVTNGYVSVNQFVLCSTQSYVVYHPAEERLIYVVGHGEIPSILEFDGEDAEIVPYGAFRFSYDKNFLELERYSRYEAQTCGNAVEALCTALQRVVTSNEHIELDVSRMPYQTVCGIREVYPEAGVSGNAAFYRARMIKAAEEIEGIARSAQVAEQGLLDSLRAFRPGDTEQALERGFQQAIAKHGAKEIFFVATANERAAYSDTRNMPVPIGMNSFIRFDYGCDLEGYTSDLARTVCIGAPSEKLRRLYDAVWAGTDAAIKAARPGVRACELFRIAVETTRKAGIPDYRRHHVGHCLGLEVYDDPSVTPDNQTVLEENMVLNIETPYYELGWGGVQVEDTIAITKNGAVRLDQTDNHMIVLEF